MKSLQTIRIAGIEDSGAMPTVKRTLHQASKEIDAGKSARILIHGLDAVAERRRNK